MRKDQKKQLKTVKYMLKTNQNFIHEKQFTFK